MYKNGEGVAINKQKALQYFKEGANKKCIDCYAEMASFFNSEGHLENEIKCWNKYFELSVELSPSYVHTYMQDLFTSGRAKDTTPRGDMKHRWKCNAF